MTNVTIRGIQSLSGYAAFDQNYGATSMYIDDTPITSGQMPDRQNGRRDVRHGTGQDIRLCDIVSFCPSCRWWNAHGIALMLLIRRK